MGVISEEDETPLQKAEGWLECHYSYWTPNLRDLRLAIKIAGQAESELARTPEHADPTIRALKKRIAVDANRMALSILCHIREWTNERIEGYWRDGELGNLIGHFEPDDTYKEEENQDETA